MKVEFENQVARIDKVLDLIKKDRRLYNVVTDLKVAKATLLDARNEKLAMCKAAA